MQHAHELLFDTFKDLEADKKRVPRELYQNLCLLHSYVLVKVRRTHTHTHAHTMHMHTAHTQ